MLYMIQANQEVHGAETVASSVCSCERLLRIALALLL